jgi:predicted transcriptional regulator
MKASALPTSSVIGDRQAVWERVHELRASRPTREENVRARRALYAVSHTLRSEGFTPVEIASIVRVHPATVRRYLRLASPPTVPGCPLGILPARPGMSVRRIAREVGIDMRTVQRYLASPSPPRTAHGVPLATRRDAVAT